MSEKSLIAGKRILIVDDEMDVLDSLEDLLTDCELIKASTFEDARRLLEWEKFDLAILDIMGVNGYELLKIANNKGVKAVMLTANALSPEDTVKSHKEGAALYVPKDKIAEIETYLNDVLEGEKKGKSTWWRWIERFASLYDQKFDKEWRYKDKTFWMGFPYA